MDVNNGISHHWQQAEVLEPAVQVLYLLMEQISSDYWNLIADSCKGINSTYIESHMEGLSEFGGVRVQVSDRRAQLIEGHLAAIIIQIDAELMMGNAVT